jgi:hypothetical protein
MTVPARSVVDSVAPEELITDCDVFKYLKVVIEILLSIQFTAILAISYLVLFHKY